jgi:hypothetical protein
MSEIDYALDFIGPTDSKPRQLRFRRNFAPRNDPRIFDGTGQLVAAVADGHRSDNGDEHRPHNQPRPHPGERPDLAKLCHRGPVSSPIGRRVGRAPFFLPAAVAAAPPARPPKRPPLVAEIRSHSPLLPSAGSQSNRPGARPVNPRPRRTTQAE